MKNKGNIFHYSRLAEFNRIYFNGVLNLVDIDSEEIAIKNQETKLYDYYYIAKKDNIQYLLPSKFNDSKGNEFELLKNMPIRPKVIDKIPYRGKAYLKVKEFSKIKIQPEQTFTFRYLVDSFCDYEHLEPSEFLLWKLTAITAHIDRINVRVITMPGWGKDSVVTCLKMLFGDGTIVNKPSIAKLKYLLSSGNKFLGLNEVQDLKKEDIDDLAKFYEDVGDFKPYYENPRRAKEGTSETVDIGDLSTVTFYNFPESDEEKSQLFDSLFKPKIRSRIFPLLFTGGDQKDTACREDFKIVHEGITSFEQDFLKEFMRNYLYYAVTYPKGTFKYQRTYNFDGNVRWKRNFETILSRIDMYAKDQEEFSIMESQLYMANKRYVDYINNNITTEMI